jgi:hypothetical protein
VIDPSRKAEAAILRGTLHGAVFQHIGDSLREPERARAVIAESRAALAEGAPAGVASSVDAMLSGIEGLLDSGGTIALGADAGPVDLEMSELAAGDRTVPVTAYALTFPQGAAWGLMACALGASLSLVSERTRGTLVRLTLAPIARWEILAGKALACFVISLVMLTVLVGVAHLPFFGVRPESYAMLALASVCSCAAFVGVMMLIASFGKTVAAVEGFGRAMLLVLALVGRGGGAGGVHAGLDAFGGGGEPVPLGDRGARRRDLARFRAFGDAAAVRRAAGDRAARLRWRRGDVPVQPGHGRIADRIVACDIGTGAGGSLCCPDGLPDRSHPRT